MSEDIRKMIDKIKNFKQFMNEVNYLKPNQFGKPKNDNELDGDKIRVYHGIDRSGTIEKILKVGLSGNQKINRINSNDTSSESGLFVTINFNLAKRYASSGNIIEFTANVSDLKPVQDGASGTYDYKTAYDNLLSPTKSEALYIGDLNPNMIKFIWKYDCETYEWNKYERKEFIKKYIINTKRSKLDLFLPNDDFDMDKIIGFYGDEIKSIDFKRFVTKLATAEIGELSKLRFFFPKQIKQIIKLRDDGFFGKYL
jgi:hypothetical protein